MSLERGLSQAGHVRALVSYRGAGWGSLSSSRRNGGGGAGSRREYPDAERGSEAASDLAAHPINRPGTHHDDKVAWRDVVHDRIHNRLIRARVVRMHARVRGAKRNNELSAAAVNAVRFSSCR